MEEFNYIKASQNTSDIILNRNHTAERLSQAEEYWVNQKDQAYKQLRAIRLIKLTLENGYGIGDVVLTATGEKYKITDHSSQGFEGIKMHKDGTRSIVTHLIYTKAKKITEQK